jgi:quercetin dioxygenase-like cupin family protein
MRPNDDCFCDLASLYALNVLDEEERRLVEEELAQYPELAEELASLESAVAAMAYSAPPMSIAPDLKDRLFQTLELEPPEEWPVTAGFLPEFFVARSQEMDWQPHPVPGISVKILYTDPIKRELVGMLKAEPGCCYPLHRHTIAEEIYMLQGDLTIEDTVYGVGDYIRSSAGSVHAPTTEGGCMFFFRSSLDDEYLE